MSTTAADTAKGWLNASGQELAGWLKGDAPRLLFSLKICLAALLAMVLSMLLELDQPRTAMITVFVVMQPETGMVLAKSLYRIAATVVGTLAALVLVGAFAQQRELFLLGLALWIGICTAGAAFHRNFRSYGFVLAGYTAAMIGLPSAVQPDTFFTTAVTRLSEICLGIVCAGVVSDLIFPRPLAAAIYGNVESRYAAFISLVRASLSGSATAAQLEKMQLSLVSKVLALESLRSAAVLEDPELRARDRSLRKLNSEFMAAATTFYSFHQLMKRLTRDQTPAGELLQDIYRSLGGLVGAEAPGSAAAASRTARRIAALRVLLARRAREAELAFPAGEGGGAAPGSLQDFRTALHLLNRFLREMHGYTRSYAALGGEQRVLDPQEDVRFDLRTDPVVALVSGLRAFLALLVASYFWIASGWAGGASMVMNAGIVSALFAAAPDPPAAVRRMVTGFSAGLVAAVLFKFLVVPSLDTVLLLCVAMFPVLMLGAHLVSRPKQAAIGHGFLIFFSYITSPTNPMTFNATDAVNEGIATLIGIAVAGVVFATLAPVNGAWGRKRVLRQLRRQVEAACFEPVAGLRERFESGTRDLLHKQVVTAQPDDHQQRLLVGWFLSVLEIGHAVIQLRQVLHDVAAPAELEAAVKGAVSALAGLYRRPGREHREAALQQVALALRLATQTALLPAADDHSSVLYARLRTSLHLIQSALLDEEGVLMATTAVSAANPGEAI
ncbi:MAG TPA: FUSC family protein [Geomonas sp.]|nr:FUSC family protein [Geomonas sp.]